MAGPALLSPLNANVCCLWRRAPEKSFTKELLKTQRTEHERHFPADSSNSRMNQRFSRSDKIATDQLESTLTFVGKARLVKV